MSGTGSTWWNGEKPFVCGGETKLSKDLMLLLHGAMHPMQFRAALFLILKRQRLQWLPINSISPLNISCFLLFLYFSGGKVCSTFEAIAWFRLLIFNVFHFCVYNVCCKFAAVAQYAQITPISPLAMYVIFRCASISWFQAVSGSVTYRFYS